ncbi:MAG: ribbon-helix-helix protein, CopG family [candidate division Zixibacteria bacterium]|nr:ribbon-helix-helix protein, CopG family [candidate division Zixibacteria bacterium]
MRFDLKSYKVLSISIPPQLLTKVESWAKKENRTKSEFLREAIRKYIEEREWLEIQRYGYKRARELGKRPEDVEDIIDDIRDK